MLKPPQSFLPERVFFGPELACRAPYFLSTYSGCSACSNPKRHHTLVQSLALGHHLLHRLPLSISSIIRFDWSLLTHLCGWGQSLSSSSPPSFFDLLIISIPIHLRLPSLLFHFSHRQSAIHPLVSTLVVSLPSKLRITRSPENQRIPSYNKQRIDTLSSRVQVTLAGSFARRCSLVVCSAEHLSIHGNSGVFQREQSFSRPILWPQASYNSIPPPSVDSLTRVDIFSHLDNNCNNFFFLCNSLLLGSFTQTFCGPHPFITLLSFTHVSWQNSKAHSRHDNECCHELF